MMELLNNILDTWTDIDISEWIMSDIIGCLCRTCMRKASTLHVFYSFQPHGQIVDPSRFIRTSTFYDHVYYMENSIRHNPGGVISVLCQSLGYLNHSIHATNDVCLMINSTLYYDGTFLHDGTVIGRVLVHLYGEGDTHIIMFVAPNEVALNFHMDEIAEGLRHTNQNFGNVAGIDATINQERVCNIYDRTRTLVGLNFNDIHRLAQQIKLHHMGELIVNTNVFK